MPDRGPGLPQAAGLLWAPASAPGAEPLLPHERASAQGSPVLSARAPSTNVLAREAPESSLRGKNVCCLGGVRAQHFTFPRSMEGARHDM